MWKAIRSFLFSRHEESPRGGRLVPVDADLVAEDFDVLVRGTSDGRNGSPDADSTNFTLAEVEVTGFF